MCYGRFWENQIFGKPMNTQIRKFSWSWSKLKNFRTCPKRHYEIDIAKRVKEDESEALRWGHAFHEAMAKRIEKNAPLPTTLRRYDKWPAKLAKKVVSVELKLAMDEQFQPTAWFDNHTWFRGVVDVLGLVPPKALAIDWKTGGKIEPEFEQLGLTSQLIFAHHPEVDTVDTAYQWTAHDTETIKTYKREDMVGLWSRLLPEVRRMEEAARTLTYPPKPSGLCIRYCPVTSCPYHGKGTRG
jgi:hypothetical protein